MAETCKTEMSSFPLLGGCFGVGEYVLVGNATGGSGIQLYARRDIIDIIYCSLPLHITSANFEDNGTDYLNNIFANYQAELFWNNASRYLLMSDAEWNYLYDNDNVPNGVRIATEGFDTTVSNFDLIVILKNKYSVPIIGDTAITSNVGNDIDAASSVYFNGNGTVSDKGFCWSINPNPTLADNSISAGSGIGAIVASILDLDAPQAYYIRAYAVNEYGVGYGAFTTFTTSSPPPPDDLLLINSSDTLMINPTDSFIL